MKKHDISPNYFYLALILTALPGCLFPQFNIITYPFNLPGFIVVAIGVLVTYVSWKVFIDHGTSESYRKDATCLVSDGLYAYSRNPMYIGMILIVLGLWIYMMMNLLALAGPVSLFLVLNFRFIPYEESVMSGQFGEEFTAYMKKVRRWL
ncbi:methyltransferase family protein [Methanolacinia petrolearia]|uniref:methyltransferase family protein n=1 Tax=Methanolacinia petrolearia TaxID=54120 RepID=UPI003BAA9635